MKVDDSSDLGAAFERHRGRLTAIAVRILGDAHEAQDVVQEGFLRWQGAAGRDGIRTPAAWLTTVVQNLAIDRLRQRERAWEVAQELALLDGGTSGSDGGAVQTPEDVLARLFDLSAVLAVLRARLSEAERIVLVLHEACEREHEEIARLLRISEANSRQLLHRARKRLARDARQEQEEQRCRELVHEFHLALHRLDVPVLIGLLSDAAAVSACAKPATEANAMILDGASTGQSTTCGTVVAGATPGRGARDISASAAGLEEGAASVHSRWARGAVGSLLVSCLAAARAAQTRAVAAVN
ncbi:sigma-70 family RNA polymerase sigma factor [Zemynaea arenosa]|nr:sigma-70 family RNA polymerase sigma factor [Massilia arenosa]